MTNPSDTSTPDAQRRAAARDDVLRWLHDTTVRGVSPYLNKFTGSEFDLADGGYTTDEVNAASRSLKTDGYLTGAGSGGGGIARPEITPTGERAVMNDISVNATPPTQGGWSIVGSNNTVANHSPNTTQTVVTISAQHQQAILDVANALQQMAPMLGLTTEQQAEADEVETELRQLATQPADAGRVRAAFDRVKSLAATARHGVAMATALAALVGTTRQAIGL